jgi:putative Holliday junction resolvase
LSPWAAKVQEFAEKLHERSGLPVELWDERLSSVAAHEILDEAGRDRRDRKYVIDQVAAVVILRGWMEFREQAAALEQQNLHKQNCANEEDSLA